MKKMGKGDNGGFSLVELIIVIAIMAILVGIIGSQVIPYLEKSKVSKDITTLDTAYSNFQNSLADVAAKNGTTPTASGTMDTDTSDCFKENVGMDSSTIANKLSSKKSTKGTINFYAGSNGTDTYVCVTSNKLSVCSICGKKEDGTETHLAPSGGAGAGAGAGEGEGEGEGA